jgi:hypothetical protein
MARFVSRRCLGWMAFGMGLLLWPAVSWGAPLVYIQLLARPDGTDDAFSSTVTATSVGEEFDWIVVATLAPAGTVNTNLAVDPGTGLQDIASWQSDVGTANSVPNTDGMQAVLFSLFQNPNPTANPTQVSFQNTAYLGHGSGGSVNIDQNVFNGLQTKRTTNNNSLLNGNATFTGGVNTSSYTYSTFSGNVQGPPAVTLAPNGLAQSSSGYALFENYGIGTGATGGTVALRGDGSGNLDLTRAVALGAAGAAGYHCIDPNTGVSGQTATNESPVTVILASGSHSGGQSYNNDGYGDPNGNNSTFEVTTLAAGSSTLSINLFDTNPGNPGVALNPNSEILSLQYHNSQGTVVKPGNNAVLQYSAQISSDPVIQFTGLTIVSNTTNAPGAAPPNSAPGSFGAAATGTIVSGGGYAGLAVQAPAGSSNDGEGPVEMTTATILAGTNSDSNPVTVADSFANRTLAETPASQGGAVPATGLALVSDVLMLTRTDSMGQTPTDPYALQLNYDPTALNGDPNVLARDRQLYLSYLDPNGGGVGIAEWENATIPDTGNNATAAEQDFLGSFATFQSDYGTDLTQYIGAWGVDTSTNTVWAVVDHTSMFSATLTGTLVPEPATLSLAALGILVLAGRAMARRRKPLII